MVLLLLDLVELLYACVGKFVRILFTKALGFFVTTLYLKNVLSLSNLGIVF